MSRIGKKIIAAVSGVKVAVLDGEVSVEGQKGKLKFKLPGRIGCEVKDGQVLVTAPSIEAKDKSLHGLTRSIIANMVMGVSVGYVKELEIQGVGFRAAAQGNILTLILGFSHPVSFPIPGDIKIETPKPTQVIVRGIDKQRVGETAARIRRIYPPEPYKGKGIRYLGEAVRRKVGKSTTK